MALELLLGCLFYQYDAICSYAQTSAGPVVCCRSEPIILLQVLVLLETEEVVAQRWRPVQRPGSGIIRKARIKTLPILPFYWQVMPLTVHLSAVQALHM